MMILLAMLIQDWRYHGAAAETFRADGDTIVCSGSPAGYMYTAESYRDFTLRFDWRYATAKGGNSGVLLFIRKPDVLGVWPESVEVQGLAADAGRILPIPRSLRCEFEAFEADRAAASRPADEWNAMEIISSGGVTTVAINDVRVSVVTACELVEGPIGFQSEGAEIHFRNIRLSREATPRADYKRPAIAPSMRLEGGYVAIDTRGATVRYTLDGTTPTRESRAYVSAFLAPKGATVSMAVLPEDNPDLFFARGPVLASAVPAVPRSGLRVVSADSEETDGEDGRASNAIDGNPRTHWHTAWSQEAPKHPHEIVVDAGEEIEIAAVGYLPRQDGGVNGTIGEFELYVSADGKAWGDAAATGTLGGEKTVKVGRRGRYVKLVALSEVNGNSWTSAAEIHVYE